MSLEEISTGEIYANYTYTKPADLLPFVRDFSSQGDAEGVLRAIDAFSEAFPMYKTGPEKGRILEAVTRLAAPSLAVELGSFIGYGAVRIARSLPPGAQLVCVEANQECVAAMEGVLSWAGVRDRVVIKQGLARDVIPSLAQAYGPAGLLFLDHCKPCYAPDLLLAETTGLLQQGGWVLADNVVIPPPGTPELLARLVQPSLYAAALLPALYEVERRWASDYDGQPKMDALAVAIMLEGEGGAAAMGRAQAQALLQELAMSVECMPLGQSRVVAAAAAAVAASA